MMPWPHLSDAEKESMKEASGEESRVSKSALENLGEVFKGRSGKESGRSKNCR